MMILPYEYYFYGSEDSTDVDVLIKIEKNEMPLQQEERKIFVKKLEEKYELFDWNINLIVVENGIISDTIYPKAWIDSLNNAFYHTYNFHKQIYNCPIDKTVKRHKFLAIYKTIRTILTSCTRTHYRNDIKPILKGLHDFNKKIELLPKIDFTSIKDFNQDNTKNIDIWKIIAFYLGQNIALIRDNKEIYTKKELVKSFPELYDFIYRKDNDPKIINLLIKDYVEIIKNYGDFKNDNYLITCSTGEKIDSHKEIFII
ncbi:MAG: hypothetical protein U0457_05110 [Candidatus Sericytochromatia bacterium]